jgi:hypothetical protein
VIPPFATSAKPKPRSPQRMGHPFSREGWMRGERVGHSPEAIGPGHSYTATTKSYLARTYVPSLSGHDTSRCKHLRFLADFCVSLA